MHAAAINLNSPETTTYLVIGVASLLTVAFVVRFWFAWRHNSRLAAEMGGFTKTEASLARQREYFSERAITDADAALALVLGRLEEICGRAGGDQVISKLLRQFNAVTGLSGWSDPRQLH